MVGPGSTLAIEYLRFVSVLSVCTNSVARNCAIIRGRKRRPNNVLNRSKTPRPSGVFMPKPIVWISSGLGA